MAWRRLSLTSSIVSPCPLAPGTSGQIAKDTDLHSGAPGGDWLTDCRSPQGFQAVSQSPPGAALREKPGRIRPESRRCMTGPQPCPDPARFPAGEHTGKNHLHSRTMAGYEKTVCGRQRHETSGKPEH
jgi:hypothetical protein